MRSLPSVLLAFLLASPAFAQSAQRQASAEAPQDYASATARTPNDAALRVKYGNALLSARNYPDAIAQFQEALRIAPHRLDAQLGLATAYRGVHNYDEAKRILEAAHREHPASAAPLANLGDLEVELQTYDAAIAHLKAAIALDPRDVESRERLAISYKAKGDAADALAQVSAILARDPKKTLAYFTRAEIYADKNQDALARKDAERVVALQPQNPRGRALLGKILLRNVPGETPVQAKQRCERAVAILEPLNSDPADPADSDSLFLLARAYECAGDGEKADQANAAFEKSSKNDRTTKENQTQAKHLVQQAGDLAQHNDFDGSMKILEQSIALDPTYGAAYSQLAKIYYSEGRIDQASDAIAKAIDRDANQPDYLYVRGKIYEKQNKLDQALADFKRTTEIDPSESDAYFEMGQIYQQQGDRASALKSYEAAARLTPDDPDYKRALESLRAPTAH
jgi:tetratricopeptide (TPR) repeat protein